MRSDESIKRTDIAEDVPPNAATMVESLRAYGYSLSTAIADIIDNSISAHASRVWLKFIWRNENSYIAIIDDGRGMDLDGLVEAMRPGTRKLTRRFEPTDLGRFGLGLKTASFSQCRSCTVLTKIKSQDIIIRRWDIDYICKSNSWQLLKNARPGTEAVTEQLNMLDQGTAVVWQDLDRILGNDASSNSVTKDRFWVLTEEVERHLAMVFHRYLSGLKPRLRIFINDNGDESSKPIVAWDPFASSIQATIHSPVEEIEGVTGNIHVQGFVLPHRDKLTDANFEDLSGPRGWLAQQGFYVYRNERLLVPGHWLGLGAGRSWVKEEHYKLARIKLDIPVSADEEWQIDVKKSAARPPAIIRPRLTQLAAEIRRKAREVFVHRGSYGSKPKDINLTRLWFPVSENNNSRFKYKIDRTHPVVKSAIDSSNRSNDVETMIKILEETVPVERIWLDVAEGNKQHGQPFEGYDSQEIVETMQRVFLLLLANGNLSEAKAREVISNMDAFKPYTSLVKSLSGKEQAL